MSLVEQAIARMKNQAGAAKPKIVDKIADKIAKSAAADDLTPSSSIAEPYTDPAKVSRNGLFSTPLRRCAPPTATCPEEGKQTGSSPITTDGSNGRSSTRPCWALPPRASLA